MTLCHQLLRAQELVAAKVAAEAAGRRAEMMETDRDRVRRSLDEAQVRSSSSLSCFILSPFAWTCGAAWTRRRCAAAPPCLFQPAPVCLDMRRGLDEAHVSLRPLHFPRLSLFALNIRPKPCWVYRQNSWSSFHH